MKRDEIKAIFPDATDAQIDEVLNRSGAELTALNGKISDLSGRLEEAASSLEEHKAKSLEDALTIRELTEKAQAGMSAEELLAQREEQAKERERDFLIKSNALDAKAVFVEAGLSEEQYAPLLEQVVSDDSEKTLALSKQIASLAASQREEAAAAAKDELLKGNPGFVGASGSGAMTKEEFNNLPLDDQVDMVEKNPGLIESLK